MPTFAVGLVLRQVFVMVLGLLSVAFVYNIFLFFSSGMFQGVIWFGTSSTLLLSFANLLLLLIYVILKSAGKIASKADKNMFVVYIIYFIIDRFFSWSVLNGEASLVRLMYINSIYCASFAFLIYSKKLIFGDEV